MKLKGTRKRFIIAFVVIAALLIIVNALWRSHVQREQAEHEMLETTQVLATEMDAIWDFMERSQNQFVRNEDGTYNLYCVVAAKAVAKLFTVKSDDFIIHYTNLTTRKPDDAPDAFETEALEALLANPESESYYDLVAEDDGTYLFRYVEPLYYKESCLECHGSPAGELDVMGYPKEGKQIDELAGAASIIMPAETYMSNVNETVIQETIVFGILIVVGLAAIFWAVSSVTAVQMRRLEEENKLKSDFLAMVSHEVRTPLTSILAFSDIWASSNEPRNAEEAKIMGEMRLHSQVLLSMVNNMLELARVEAGRMELVFEPVDVADLLGMVRENLKYLAQKKEVDISCSVERNVPVLLASYDTLRRILENLVSNAIKFVNTGGQVQMYASYDRTTEMLTLTVRDNGCGINPQDLPYVFDRFVQGSVSEQTPKDKTQGGTKLSSGSGLGLALVKELAELHGGSIAVESTAGEGSVFTVQVKAGALEIEDEDTVS